MHTKKGKSENEKKQGNGKKQGLEGEGFFSRSSFLNVFPSSPRILGFGKHMNPFFLVVFLAVFQNGKEKKIRRGGGEHFEFSGVPEFHPFLQRFYRKSSIWGSKVQALEGQLSG